MLRKFFQYFYDGEVFVIQGSKPGKKLVITAGIDGDEYCGIEAAQRLKDTLQTTEFSGEVVIIPILNLAGYKAGQSANPEDGLLPKYIFPGNWWGSASHRLMRWFTKTHLKNADAWLDLHGGNKHEALHPFLWTFQTPSRTCNEISLQMQAQGGCEFGVHQKAMSFSKAYQLARKKCTYIMAESGQLGVITEEDVTRHMNWVYSLMQVLGMITIHEPIQSIAPTLYSKVHIIYAPFDGEWKTNLGNPSITAQSLLGSITTQQVTKEFNATQNAQLVWLHVSGTVAKGDEIAVLAYEHDIIVP